MKKLLVATVLAVLTLGSVSAYATRKNPLEGQPAVRKRVKFLRMRFEVTPRVGLTYLQDFKHSFLIGVGAEFHVASWLSFGAFFDYAAVSWDTQLTNEIVSTLPDHLNPNTRADPAPSKSIMKKALDTMMFQAGVYAAYSPWFGKLSLFGKIFAHFDFYILAGAGFAMFNDGTLAVGCGKEIDPTGQCDSGVLYMQRTPNGGNSFKIGPLWGFGVRFRILRWIAINMSLQDIIIKRNSAGFDRTGDTVPGTDVVIVDKKDESWENLMSFTIGVSFLLPTAAPRSK